MIINLSILSYTILDLNSSKKTKIGVGEVYHFVHPDHIFSCLKFPAPKRKGFGVCPPNI